MNCRTQCAIVLFGATAAVVLTCGGCGPSTESAKTETATPVAVTKESLFKRGHQLYVLQKLDSARVLLNQALAMDAEYKEALSDLASLNYDLAMRTESTKQKNELLRSSRDYYVKVEALGSNESETYDRICEVAQQLSDTKTFLKYAKKSADAYPYDRQYYNLSVAYSNVEDYNNVVKVCKDAIAKFKSSPYASTYYRQLGRAYTKIGRDQTAEKTFYSGLGVIDGRIAEMRRNDSGYQSSGDYARLKDDKIGILVSLKNLHTTYKEMDKLAEVERQLKELGR